MPKSKPVLSRMTDAEVKELMSKCREARRLMKKFNREFGRVEGAINKDVLAHRDSHPGTVREFHRLDKLNAKIYDCLLPEFSV